MPVPTTPCRHWCPCFEPERETVGMLDRARLEIREWKPSAEALDQVDQRRDAIGTAARRRGVEQPVRPGAEEKRPDEDRRRALECAPPGPRIEAGEGAHDEATTQRRRSTAILAPAAVASRPRSVSVFRLETRAAMGDDQVRRQMRIVHARPLTRDHGGTRGGAPRVLQTFSGSPAVRFISSAGTGRPWPKPRRLGRPAEGVRARSVAAGLPA